MSLSFWSTFPYLLDMPSEHLLTMCNNLLPTTHNPSIAINFTFIINRFTEINNRTKNRRYGTQTEAITSKTVVSNQEDG